MKKRISTQRAGQVLTALLVALVIFHLLLLTGIVPYDMVWGGRLNSAEEMQQFELMSIVINAIMILFVVLRMGWLKMPVSNLIPRIAMWLMVVLFAFNTLGNILSQNEFEKLVFTPLTLILALLSLRLALRDNPTAAA